MHIIHDIEDQSEIVSLLRATLALMPRENNERDKLMVKKALGEDSENNQSSGDHKNGDDDTSNSNTEKEESKQTSDKTTNAMKAMQSLQTNLGAFLDMYADEDMDEEEEDNTASLISTMSRRDVVDHTSEFQCCLCHSSVCESPHDTPCLLVHADKDHYPCRLDELKRIDKRREGWNKNENRMGIE